MIEPERTVVAMVSIKAYGDGRLEITGPKDLLMHLHLLTMAQKTLLENQLHKQNQEQSAIQRPGLHHVMALGKN